MLCTDISALIFVAVSAMVVTTNSAQALTGCQDKCGEVDIPYPFGIGKDCAHHDDFSNLTLTCNYTSGSGIPKIGNVRVVNISIREGQMTVNMFASNDCYTHDNRKASWVSANKPNLPRFKTRSFSISSIKNRFMAIGCDTYGVVLGYKNDQYYETGCISRCESIDGVTDDECKGVACCQVDIPAGWQNFTLKVAGYNNHSDVGTFNPCSYAFVVVSSFKFKVDYIRSQSLPKTLPMVLDWAIGNLTCVQVPNHICTKPNSKCVNSTTMSGYLCICNDGFDGNPYHPDGCNIVIDYCKNENLNNCTHKRKCKNVPGNYACGCPFGFEGDSRKDGKGCQPQISLFIGASVAFVVSVLGIFCFCLMLQKRKLEKLKESFFRQNGGFFLKQQLSKHRGSSSIPKIFSAEELNKATNNYDERLVLGRGGYGTVFKGTLADNKVVAIKKSKIVDQSQTEQFINEVVVLSQINHRNVVKLLGCCLETEVPLLVYEFVNNGTLYDYIHNGRKSSEIPLATRLRIASETALALAYLHSAASVPIIHRDVKTANILLDDSYTAKVSDFGASRLIPVDQTELATMVQGTLGYLDPEYMQTSQLTEKSDVYSFGVVLIELLTGMKPLSFDRPEERRSLAMYFLSCLKDDRLFEVVERKQVNEAGNMEMVIREVAVLAARCLRVRGDERPSMKEVASEIEGILKMIEVHPWVAVHPNQEEGQYLLYEASGLQHTGESSNGNTAAYDSLQQNFHIELGGGR